MKNRWGKRFITIALMICIPVAIVLAGAYYFLVQTTNDINRQDQQYLSEIAMQNAKIIQNTVHMQLDKIEAVANIIGQEEKLDTNRMITVLQSEQTRSAFKRMGYAALDGNAITTDAEQFSIADRDYFKKALSGLSSVSDRLVDKVDSGFINVYAVPLYHEGQVAGVVFATNETDLFTDLLNTATFGGEGFSYIVTKEGEPIVFTEHKNGLYEFSNLFDEIYGDKMGEEKVQAIKKNMEQNKNGVIEYSRGDVQRVGAYCRVGVNDWYVLSVVPTAVISQNTNRLIARNTKIVLFTSTAFMLLLVTVVIQNRKTKRHLEHVAYFDELTGFPNYNAFRERAQRVLIENPHKQFLFTKMDVQNFKLVNDRLGFDMGDRVLKNMAQALSEVASEPNELFARIMVDEFIIMFNNRGKAEMDHIRNRFRQRFTELMGPSFQYFVKFPTGRYVTDTGEDSIAEIFEKVNYAHRQAKLMTEQTGVTEFYFDDADKKKAVRETEIEDKMAAALENREFKVYLQPKYALASETVVGAEALVRWEASNASLIYPGEFIPLFEHNGFITKLDFYMFEQVCQLIRGWMDCGQTIVTVSVNFSRRHLANPHFIDELVEIANRYGVPAHNIELELTESIIFENEDLLETVLNKIHAAGFTLSMDDFGTGYSSLGLLKNLPVDVIKIDRSFFTDHSDSARANAVIESIMLMAKKLHIVTVAEGIESREHIDLLRAAGCDIVQGYYYAKPMPVEQFAALMQQQTEHAPS